MEKAIKRGVKIYLGYGYSNPGRRYEKSLKAVEALKLLRDLERKTIAYKGKLCVKEFNNHAKLILVDTEYRIVGSINWLSNSEYSNSEYSTKIYC